MITWSGHRPDRTPPPLTPLANKRIQLGPVSLPGQLLITSWDESRPNSSEAAPGRAEGRECSIADPHPPVPSLRTFTIFRERGRGFAVVRRLLEVSFSLAFIAV